ncbi:MAG: ABC transporter substrate-binding protein, partial [Pararhizobium sp.]
LQSGRYDLGLSGISDNKTREKVVTFVDYFSAGTSLVVRAGNPKHLESISDLCGNAVAIETGTSQVGFAKDQSDRCVSDGKKPIDVKTFPDETQVQLQIRTGRADAGLNDFPVAAYIALQSDGKLEAVRGGDEFSAPYGLAIAKDKPQLVKAVQAALKDVIADGTYAKILKEWNLENGALTTAAINGAGK